MLFDAIIQRAAVASHGVGHEMNDKVGEKLIAADVRFQVCLPGPCAEDRGEASGVFVAIVDAIDVAAVAV